MEGVDQRGFKVFGQLGVEATQLTPEAKKVEAGGVELGSSRSCRVRGGRKRINRLRLPSF